MNLTVIGRSGSSDAWFMAGAITVSLLAGLVAAFHGMLLVVALATVTALALVFVRPQWSVSATIVLAFTAMPAIIPRGISQFGLSVYFYESTLIVAAIYAWTQLPPVRYAMSRSLAMAAIAIFGIALGFLLGNPTSRVIEDPRGLIQMSIAILVAARVAYSPIESTVVRATKWSLWVSAILIVAASLSGIKLAGRTEDAGLSFVGQGERALSGASRFLTSATHFSLAVTCICVGLLVVRASTFRKVWTYLIPAAIVVFLSFSRNSLVALSLTVIVALLVNRQFRDFVRTVTGVAIVAVTTWIVSLFARASTDLPSVSWFVTQIDAYWDRVFSGLSGEVIASDTSAQYRVKESQYLTAAIAESPLYGHGTGYAYRPAVGPAGSYTQTSGVYYAHNFYYWLLVKSGLIGFAAFVYASFLPLIAAWKRATPRTAVLIGTLVGFLAISTVAPMPLGTDSGAALLLGSLIGLVCAEVQKPVVVSEVPAEG